MSAFLKIELGIFSGNLEKKGVTFQDQLEKYPSPGRGSALGAPPEAALGYFFKLILTLLSRYPENMPSPIFRNALKQGFSGSHDFLRDASYQLKLLPGLAFSKRVVSIPDFVV